MALVANSRYYCEYAYIYPWIFTSPFGENHYKNILQKNEPRIRVKEIRKTQFRAPEILNFASQKTLILRAGKP